MPTIAELLLPEYDLEIATTRRVLQRVPDDRAEWRPHEKSFFMAHLAQLVAGIPAWAVPIMTQLELDIAPENPAPGSGYRVQPVASLLEQFDRGAAAGRAAIAAATPEDWDVQWTLKARGHAVDVKPRYLMLRTTVLNHLVHHRAQLGVYLRLLERPVPPMYGPTADER